MYLLYKSKVNRCYKAFCVKGIDGLSIDCEHEGSFHIQRNIIHRCVTGEKFSRIEKGIFDGNKHVSVYKNKIPEAWHCPIFFIFSLKYGLNGKQDNTTYLSLVVPLRLILGSSRGPYLRCSPKCESALDDKACLWLMETWFWTKSVQKMSAHAQPEPEVNQQVFKMYFGPAIPGVRVNLSRKNDRGYFNEWLLLWHRLTKGFRHKIIFVLYSI